MPLETPDFLLAGHVCRDVVDGNPGWRPGGAVYYAAATAAKLGCSVGVLTAGAPAELEALRDLPRTTVIAVESRQSTSFENRYELGQRRQFLRALAPSIPMDILPPEWTKARLALLAPVASELPAALARAFPPSTLLAVAPQGWLRRLVVGQEVGYQPWQGWREVLARAAAVVFSEEDLHGHLPDWFAYPGSVLAMTRGALGCDVIVAGKRRHVPGSPAEEVDPTGAGDVFAAAFLVRLGEVREPLAAARFANEVAAHFVAAHGIEGLPIMA